jgi:4-hydroxybenzoate polyprenyltransferase
VNFFRSLARFIVFRNVWIAIGAVAMLEETRWFLGEPVAADSLAIFVFFATFFEYNLHSFSGRFNIWEPLAILRYLTGSDIKPVLRVCVLVGFAGSLVCFFLLPIKIMIAVALFALFTIAYTLPLIKRKEKFVRLREVTYLKVFTVAFVWSFVTVIIPILDINADFSITEAAIIFIRRFLFIYAITIPFEIRDVEREKLFGNVSLPMIYGIKTIKIIGLVFILVFIILSGLHEKYFSFVLEKRLNIFVPLTLSALAAAWLIVNTSNKRTNWYFKFWTDGTMVLQFILLLIFNQ